MSQTIYILSLYGQTKRSQFFSRHFSVRFSEWATYISLFVSCITHICVSHNLVSHIIHILCPCMDKQNARNASGHFSVRISEWATYISLFVSHPLSTFVSHTILCLALSTFEPHLSHTLPVGHIWASHNLYTSQRSHIWALQPVSVATLSHPIVYKHCIKATFELCIPIRSHIWASHLGPPIVFHISLRPHLSSQNVSRTFFRPNFRVGYRHKLNPHLRFHTIELYIIHIWDPTQWALGSHIWALHYRLATLEPPICLCTFLQSHIWALQFDSGYIWVTQ